METEHIVDILKRMDRFELWQVRMDDWQRQMDIKQAKAEVDRIHIDKRFDQLEKTIESFKSNLRFLTYAIIGAGITQIIGFIFDGGFK